MRSVARRSLVVVMVVFVTAFTHPVSAVDVTVVHPDDEMEETSHTPVGVGYQLGAVGNPQGGSYLWSKLTGPGNVDWGGTQDSYAPTFKADAKGTYIVEVLYTHQQGSDTDSSGNIVVFEGSLTIDGVSDENEENPGGFVCAEEDSPRKKITLGVQNVGDLSGGKMMLAVVSGGSKIEIWTAAEGGDKLYPNNWHPPQPNPLEFPVSASKDLWVQGVSQSSTARDVWLDLDFTIWDIEDWMEWGSLDRVKFTVVNVNLSATDLDGTVSEEDEEDPGAYVHYNIDNDNGNTQAGEPIADKDDVEDMVIGENDLKIATASVGPSLEVGSVVLKRSNTKTRVWRSNVKGGADYKILVELSEKSWDFSNEAQRNEFNNQIKDHLWVEGYQNNGTSNLTFEYRDPNDNLVCSDTVKYTFIGAVCARQPKPSERSTYHTWFPQLVHCEWSITGEDTNAYNCVAWSVELADRWIQGTVYYDGQYWEELLLQGVLYESLDKKYGDADNVFEIDPDLDAFYSEKKGYSRYDSGPSDAKVIWYSGNHAAVSKGCGCGAGKWIMFESKNSWYERIEHVFDQLDNSTIGYGQRIWYYK